MRKISSKKYAISLYESLQDGKKNKIPVMIQSFVKLLVRNKDLKKADKVIKAFRDYTNEQENILAVSVFSVDKLDRQLKTEIIRHLKSSFQKEIELQEYLDQDLIGGMVLKYGDVVADGSVKKRIESLADVIRV